MKYIPCKCFIIASCEIFNVYTMRDFPNFYLIFYNNNRILYFLLKTILQDSLESELMRSDPCMLVNVFHSGRTI